MNRAVVMVGAMTLVSLLLLGIALLFYRDAANSEPAEPVLVDPVAGTVQGVALGDTRAQVEAKLGPAPPWNGDQSVAPLEEDWTEIGAPSAMSYSGRPYVLRYPHTSVELENGRVIAVTTAERGAVTPSGVGVGDDLGSVRQAYPSLNCGEAPIAGGHGGYPACRGRLAQGRWLWFGEDPIRSMSLASRRLG
jgi:hypothetical protein